ncbi:hypothetical protein [Streptomyces sp. LaBMicrA B280]|uniref:hypothetical protein n=1 Tax=Streptomyces sp. LaBMicrA B280 TaxID=3391001 RepID=UPI003BA7C8FF
MPLAVANRLVGDFAGIAAAADQVEEAGEFDAHVPLGQDSAAVVQPSQAAEVAFEDVDEGWQDLLLDAGRTGAQWALPGGVPDGAQELAVTCRVEDGLLLSTAPPPASSASLAASSAGDG